MNLISDTQITERLKQPVGTDGRTMPFSGVWIMAFESYGMLHALPNTICVLYATAYVRLNIPMGEQFEKVNIFAGMN